MDTARRLLVSAGAAPTTLRAWKAGTPGRAAGDRWIDGDGDRLIAWDSLEA